MCFVDRVYKLTRLQKGIVYGGEPLQVIQMTVIIIITIIIMMMMIHVYEQEMLVDLLQ